ncbi:tripartite tricarboxylate transporter substrate-binding protein [Bradyrhizobium sp. ORS 86]|uniref:tripartite tricarboxylate transporter substrate-binding protein n=1 Tax=Bradyrhizobium sp. ORS 86 TaxID=1685970 RepID=UPI00388E3D4E
MHRTGLKLLAALVFAAAVGQVEAKPFPSRPITMVVPFAPGAPVDLVGRLVAERMRTSLGQPIILENVSGGGGSLGVSRAVRAAPDGYTISLGNISSHVLDEAIFTLPFDVLNDFEPVALLASNPQLILSTNAVPASDLNGLVDWLKAHADKASAGTGGIGGVAHVAGIFFQEKTGTRFQFVPYRGTNLAQQDLIGGQIDLLFDQAVSALANVRAGKIRAYAVTSKARLASAPDIPTVDEAGLPGFHISVWNAIWVPKGTPKEIIAKLNAAAKDALGDPALRRNLDDLGLEIPPLDQQTPEALGAFHKAEVDKWWPIIKAAHIKAE